MRREPSRRAGARRARQPGHDSEVHCGGRRGEAEGDSADLTSKLSDAPEKPEDDPRRSCGMSATVHFLYPTALRRFIAQMTDEERQIFSGMVGRYGSEYVVKWW